MSKILIEKYRGYDIEFNSDTERFECICVVSTPKESPSFSAIKKYIDDYKKENQGFEPFWIIRNPKSSFYSSERLKVTGIRKDGRFVAEKEDGRKQQISDYDISDYIIYLDENIPYLSEYSKQLEKEQKQREEDNGIRKDIVSKLKVITLKEYKNSLL